jgi:phosphoribosylformylglycinamidine (FGAM) synthase-like enzyme
MNNIAILANFATNERMVVFVNPKDPSLVKMVNDKYGGNWVVVNEMQYGDVVKFNSDDIYMGFDNRENDNYCKGSYIKKVF